MIVQLHRRLQAALAAVLGGVSLAALWPLIGVTADPAMCLGLSPEQAWVGVHLHLVSASPACANGGYAATDALAPMVGITLAISVSALVLGLLTLAFAGGGVVAVQALLRRVGRWLRRHLLVAWEALSPVPSAAVVRVRVDGRPARRHYSVVQRRGPPFA